MNAFDFMDHHVVLTVILALLVTESFTRIGVAVFARK
jgi:hypothetical protein